MVGTFFEEFEIDTSDELSVNLDEIVNVLNRYKGEETLNLFADDSIFSLDFVGEDK